MQGFDLGTQSFETLYANIIDWFQRIKEKKVLDSNIIDRGVLSYVNVSRTVVIKLN